MSSLRVLIVDDEPLARLVLRQELAEMPGIEIAAEAEDGESALERIRELRPDLVFLDLQMPGKSGFDVIGELTGSPLPLTIIVTAFDQHAIRALDAGAIDYLLKPVRRERLQQSVDRARHLLAKPGEVADHLARLQQVQTPGAAHRPMKIVGRLKEEYFLLDPDEVVAFQADGDQVWIVTLRKRYLATHTLKVLEERMASSNFQRVHRNALVNVKHVRKMSPLSSQRWLLTMVNEQEFVVSKRQAGVVRETLAW